MHIALQNKYAQTEIESLRLSEEVYVTEGIRYTFESTIMEGLKKFIVVRLSNEVERFNDEPIRSVHSDTVIMDYYALKNTYLGMCYTYELFMQGNTIFLSIFSNVFGRDSVLSRPMLYSRAIKLFNIVEKEGCSIEQAAKRIMG